MESTDKTIVHNTHNHEEEREPEDSSSLSNDLSGLSLQQKSKNVNFADHYHHDTHNAATQHEITHSDEADSRNIRLDHEQDEAILKHSDEANHDQEAVRIPSIHDSNDNDDNDIDDYDDDYYYNCNGRYDDYDYDANPYNWVEERDSLWYADPYEKAVDDYLDNHHNLD